MKLWQSGNVEMRIWSRDHCPPHITATCRAESWTARLVFSMVTGNVSRLNLVPPQNAPSDRVINSLIDEVRAKRYRCRQAWWENHGDVCLDNVRISRRLSGDIVVYEPGFEPLPSGWILPKTGVYRLGIGVEAKVAWGLSETTEILLEK